MARLPLLPLLLAVAVSARNCNVFFKTPRNNIGPISMACQSALTCVSSVATFDGITWILGACSDKTPCMPGHFVVHGAYFNELIKDAPEKVPNTTVSVTLDNQCCSSDNCNQPQEETALAPSQPQPAPTPFLGHYPTAHHEGKPGHFGHSGHPKTSNSAVASSFAALALGAIFRF